MKKQLLLLLVVLSVVSCDRSFDNPSDSESRKYTEDSKAALQLVGSGDRFTGDTIRFFGGVTSEPVEEAELVDEYRWDFDGDGQTDTILSHADTVEVVYMDEGTYTCKLVLTDRAGFRSIAKSSVKIRKRVEKTGKLVILTGEVDTVYLVIKSRTDTVFVSNTGDSLRVKANQSGDSVQVISQSGDTLQVLPIENDTMTIEPKVKPPVYLPEFPNIPGFPDIENEECAFYTEDSSLMRTTLNCYDVMWEQTRADGYQTLDFIGKMLLDILGLPLINMFGGKYDYTFDNGVYRISTDDFDVSCAFHYGESMGAHNVDDTVMANLFTLDSYVTGVEATLSPPFYSYSQGPLYEFIDGAVSIDGSLHVSFKVNFTKLKISFYRMTVHDLASFPLGIVNDSVTLRMRHESRARMQPVYVREFDDMFHDDSITIDHGGTKMYSEPVQLKVIYEVDTGNTSSEYRFTISQEMTSQETSYGDRGDTLKLSGSYRATATLGFDEYEQAIYFRGRYSSTVSDSSWFYCDESMENEFGTLFFNEDDGVIGLFDSEKFGYAFPYTPLRAVLWGL